MRDKTGLVVRTLRQRIESGLYPDGSALPAERLLMAEFSLSRTTIRRGLAELSHSGLIKSQAGIGSFVCRPAGTAAGAESGTRALLLVVPTLSDPYYGELLKAIEHEARRSGLSLIAAQSDYSSEAESRMLAAAARDAVTHGAIVVPTAVTAATSGAGAFAAAGKPLVYLGRWPGAGAPVADSIGPDYRQAARQATSHLLERGHRRIAYVEGLPNLPGFSPGDGYRAALAEVSIDSDPELVRILDLPSEEAGAEAIAALLASRVRFTAVLARNDVTAAGVIRALRAAGLKVPSDVAVAGINNSLLARSIDPPLTSVDTFPQVVGRMAVRLLQDRLDGTTTAPPLHVSVGSALIVRQSTLGSLADGRRRRD